MSDTFRVVGVQADRNKKEVQRSRPVTQTTRFCLEDIDKRIAECDVNITVWTDKKAEWQALRTQIDNALG